MLADLDTYVDAHDFRVDNRSLGRFVASHFEDERAQIRALIETQLSYLPSASQDFDIDELLVDVGRSASGESDSPFLDGSTIDVATFKRPGPA